MPSKSLRNSSRQERAGRLAWTLGPLFVFTVCGNANAEVIQIIMDRVSYSPPEVSAHVGDVIEWLNNDIVAHTASARSGEWDLVLAPMQKRSVTLKSPGKIDYYCRFDPNMVGQI